MSGISQVRCRPGGWNGLGFSPEVERAYGTDDLEHSEWIEHASCRRGRQNEMRQDQKAWTIILRARTGMMRSDDGKDPLWLLCGKQSGTSDGETS